MHAYTDHSNNAQLFSPSFSVDDTTIAGWLLELQRDYPGLSILHVPGTQNQAADALSRNPVFLEEDSNDTPPARQHSHIAAQQTHPILSQTIPHTEIIPDDLSDTFQSCDTAPSSTRTSTSGSDSDLPFPVNNPFGYDTNTWLLHNTPLGTPASLALPHRESSDSNSSSGPELTFVDGTYKFVGCVLGFSGDSLQPVFDSYTTTKNTIQHDSKLYTTTATLHDKHDAQVPPVFAFTGAALTLSPNAQLQGKFVSAYTTDAYLSSHLSSFTARDGLYFRPNGALYVPSACVKLVLELEHDSGGHHGQAETERRIRRKFWFPNMHALIKEYVQGCVLCGRSKPSNASLRAPLSFREFSDRPWQQVSMDFVCGLPAVNGGIDRILTVVDRGLTKRAHFIKCKSTHTAEHIAQLFLDYVYVHHGIPDSVITDQDPLFMSHFYKGLMSKLQIKLQPGAVYHPQSAA